jgi:hypothetical protein
MGVPLSFAVGDFALLGTALIRIVSHGTAWPT